MRKTPFATLAILSAAAHLIYGADPTAVLTAPVKFPILSNGREVGSQTAATGSIVTVLRKDPVTGKSLVKTSLGETWVEPGCIKNSNQEGTTPTVAVPRQQDTPPPVPASTPRLTPGPTPNPEATPSPAPSPRAVSSEGVDGLPADLHYTDDGSAITITRSTDGRLPKGDLIIPQTINGKPVTAIGDRAFFHCSELASVSIPAGVRKIGESAFDGCSGLKSISVPEGLTKIGNLAFYGCVGLTSVSIPKGVTEIGGGTFYHCWSLTSVSIDGSNPTYCTEGGVLFDKRKHVFIAYPAGKTDSSYAIPESVTEIGESAFVLCSGLTSISIPATVTKIGTGAFHGCSGLTSLSIPKGITEIGDSAFYDCSGLINVSIPASVTKIGSCAFHGCSSLTSVSITKGATEIGDSAFYGCSGLTSVSIPASVMKIGARAFEGCSGLSSIPRPKEPESPEKFTISVNGSDVEVRRFGRGEKGVVFFNNSGPMDRDIERSISKYAPLLAKGCSLFLWGYPKAKPFDGVQKAIGSWMGGGNGRVEFPGVATAVAEEIRKKTGLKKLLFVGNSLGGGVLLWDYPKLSENADNQFLLISPTEMFMPDPATLKPMKRGVLIADEKADPFVKSQALKSWIASNKSALMDKVAARGHIIVGEDGGFSHKELAEIIGLSFDQH